MSDTKAYYRGAWKHHLEKRRKDHITALDGVKLDDTWTKEELLGAIVVMSGELPPRLRWKPRPVPVIREEDDAKCKNCKCYAPYHALDMGDCNLLPNGVMGSVDASYSCEGFTPKATHSPTCCCVECLGHSDEVCQNEEGDE
jgi:hypothetical protein